LTFWNKSSRTGSGQGRVGSIYILYFFISLIDFDWIEGHLISGRVGSDQVGFGSDQFDFLKNRVGSSSDPDGSGGFLRSDRILPPLKRDVSSSRYNQLIQSPLNFFFVERHGKSSSSLIP
jgi:hypothetical protein